MLNINAELYIMLKIGDKIKIKNFKEQDMPGHIVPGMHKHLGKILTIELIDLRNYFLEECPYWYWYESDFEEVNIFLKLNDKLFKI